MKRTVRGFTLVEILIVVIILGILAAIVIPQFTNASNDARNSSVQSTLQSLRGQIELYKIQHSDTAPDVASMWNAMLSASNPAGALGTAQTAPGFVLGPYLQAAPTNPANGFSTITSAVNGPGGWYYSNSGSGYTVQAFSTDGTNKLTY